MKHTLTIHVLVSLIFLCAGISHGEPRKVNKPFVRGGQFKDLILPMPIINGLESEGIWGNENVVPRDKDNGIEDNQWCYWGGNPIKGKDGSYHIAICRWPENTGHMGWFESEVAHCISDNPFGPYQITRTIVKKGHNPEVMKMPDGTFALHVMDNTVYTSDRMPGPWKSMGRMSMDSRGFTASNRMGSNLTTEYRPDGSIVVMLKNGYIAISSTGILGPYKMVSTGNYSRATGYPEDPVIWRSRHQYHCVYNHAQDRRSAYMRSLDGVHWKNEYGLPYDASTTFYTDCTKNTWYKFERPKVLQDDLGRATHLSLAVMDVSKGADKGNDNHSSKNMIMPLVTEKAISIVGDGSITKDTQSIVLKIDAEKGFDPQEDLDVDSLRFGSDSVVNHSGGCKAIMTKADGKDLVITFAGQHGLTHLDFDFKLVGKAKTDDLVFGYALLPGKSPTASSLIALPITIKDVNGTKVLESAIENCGLEASKPQKVHVYQYSSRGRQMIKELSVAPIKPYQKTEIAVALGNQVSDENEYEIIIPGTGHEYWRMVNHNDPSVEFSGTWQDNPKADKGCFMDSEKVSDTFGDSVTFTFNGTRARVYGRLDRQAGTFDVFVDGEYLETVRCNYAPNIHIKLFQTPLLAQGIHTLEMKKVEADFNGPVAIDSFSYESTLSRQGKFKTPEKQVFIPKQANKYVCVYKPSGDRFFGPDTKHLKEGQWYDHWVPNDHTFVKDEEGKWHIFGITHPLVETDPLSEGIHEGEYASFHAVSSSTHFGETLKEHHYLDLPKILTPKDRPGEVLANHAPYIVKKDGLYHMVYGHSPIRLAVSSDLSKWEPKGNLFSDPDGARDPSLLLHNGTYYIVYCSVKCVRLRTSKDLIHWSQAQTVFNADSFDPESPSLVHFKNAFYLFVCSWDGVWDQKDIQGAYQHKTYVLHSKDPLNFGTDGEEQVVILNSHAPEIFQDEDGQWYISSVEWPNRGVSVDKLQWEEQQE